MKTTPCFPSENLVDPRLTRHFLLLCGILCLGLLTKNDCAAQSINRGHGAQTSELVNDLPQNLSLSTNVPGSGTSSFQLTSTRGTSYGRSTIAANAQALRFAMRAAAHGGNGIGSSEITCHDLVAIVSPSVAGIRSGTARIRLMVESQRQLSGTTNPWNVLVSVSLHGFASRMSFWSTNSHYPRDLVNGELFVDMPVYIGDPSQLTQSNFPNYLLLIASVLAYATGTPDMAATVSGSLTVTWGGIVSLRLDDGTEISDFSATGASGASYRYQRPRLDQTSTISKASPSALAIQWAGTSNIFYQVESTTSLESPNWSPLGAAIEGNGANALMEPLAPTGNRFFRVVDAPLQ